MNRSIKRICEQSILPALKHHEPMERGAGPWRAGRHDRMGRYRFRAKEEGTCDHDTRDFCRIAEDCRQLVTGCLPALPDSPKNATEPEKPMTDNAIFPFPMPTSAPMPKADLRRLAEDLEATFLAEMLGHAGLGGAEGAFSGGIGEEQFESFLRREQAAALVRAGGIGLAESLFRAMAGGSDHGRG